jgi:arabinofuranan 3-O-arabinosyltransferase
MQMMRTPQYNAGFSGIGARARRSFENLSPAFAAGCVLSYAIGLIMLWHANAWILDGQGKPLVADFLEVWTAGHTALRGGAASVYDPNLHHAAQVAVLGHEFKGFLGWHYPPTFLFVAAAIACLPYAAAFLVWVGATLAAYAATIAAIARSRAAVLFACAAPAVFSNIMPGQNGFLTAALIGAVLLNLEDRPILSGMFLGLLTYKPQFGILFPLALLGDKQWRVLAIACATTIVIGLAAWLAFGSGSYRGFFHFLPLMSQAVLVGGSVGWGKLQSVYSLVRWLGGGNMGALAAQGLTALACGSAVVLLWRQRVPFALKAAAISAGALLITPYLYMYDFPILVVPIAFLYRHRPFDGLEIAGIVAANLCLAAFVGFQMPIGPLAIVIVGALIVRRAAQERPPLLSALAMGSAA